MTYSLDFALSKKKSRDIKPKDIRKADCLGAGMLECVYERENSCLWAWHGVEQDALERILEYITLCFNPDFVEMSEEHMPEECICEMRLVCAIGKE